MIPQKRITVAACALFIMLGFVAGGISKLDRDSTSAREALSDSAITDSENTRREELPQTNYVLKIEDGIVVVYNEKDMLRPIMVTDIYAGSLRHADKEALSEGISVCGDFELYSLIEDFSV